MVFITIIGELNCFMSRLALCLALRKVIQNTAFL